MKTFEITIPQATIYQLRHSKFQWTFMISTDPQGECQMQYSSCAHDMTFEDIKINSFYYEYIHIDFNKGILRFKTETYDEENAVQNILDSLTIHTSPSSIAFLTMSKKARPKNGGVL